MKIVAIFLGILIFCLASCTTTRSGSAADTAAEGAIPIKPVTERRHFAKTKEQIFFAEDSAGGYTSGALDEYTVFEWDSALSGLLKETRYSASAAVLEKVEYTYKDGNNPAVKVTRVPVAVQDPRNPARTVEQDQVRTQVEYEYDQGRLIKETIKNKDGNAVSVYEYTYDAGGNRTGRIWKNGKGVKMAEAAYAYTDGKLVSSETKNAGGIKINSTVYQYDAQGNQEKQESRDAEGKITSALVSAWQDGFNVKDELLGADNAVQQRETNTYGADGELIQKVIENLQGKSVRIIKYEYTFK